MGENQNLEPSEPEQLPDSNLETDPSASSIEGPSKGTPKALDSEGKSFSELLAGAIASPPSNSTAPVSVSGVPATLLSLPTKPTRFMQMPLDSLENFPSGEGKYGISHQQALANVTAQAVQAAQKHLQGIYSSSAANMTPSPETSGSVSALNATPKLEIVPVVSGDMTTMPEKWQITVPDAKPQPLRISGRPIHDVYNWRKYGQKQVKGSEYPRSYYKCTHLGCVVKKMVVCSFDGHVTEIIYKGEHNHEPPPTKRVIGFSFVGHGEGNGALDVLVDAVAGGRANGPDPSASGGEQGALDVLVDVAAGGSVNESDPSPCKSEQCPENATGQLVPVSSDHENDGNAGAREDEVLEDEPDPKRRNTENKIIDLVPSERTVREPRVVVQTTSDLEILYDGYRWRKYGQKIIKGSPNPRSYYKCTNMGCPVRKHVERSSNDPKAVITTYEGKHNHDIPGSKHSIYIPHAVTKVRKLLAPTPLSVQIPSTKESSETEGRGGEKAQANSSTENEQNHHGGEKATVDNPTEDGLEKPNAIQDGGENVIADNPTDTKHNQDQGMELDSNCSGPDGESKSPDQIQQPLLDKNHVPVSVSILNT